MNDRLSDKGLYGMNDTFYPRGYVFAMFADEPAAQAAAAKLREVNGMGPVDVIPAAQIIAHLEQGAVKKAGHIPSVGREQQYMLRFVELAQQGRCGLLAKVDNADTDAISATLASEPVELAYLYGLLVIEELVDSTKRAEDAAAGDL